MTIDIRIPLGLLFCVIGSLLIVYGTSSGGSARLFGTLNLNAAWGAVLLLFGLWMLVLAYRYAARLRDRAGLKR